MPDTMTNQPDADTNQLFSAKNLSLDLLSSDEAERAGIRVTRAEFSRMMECSRQCVTDWVQAGRIVVGADGRFDPRQAVASLLRTGDPARIRAKVLEPLVRDIGQRDRRIAELEAKLADALEDAAYHEENVIEVLGKLEAFQKVLATDWEFLHTAPPDDGLASVLSWLEVAMKNGAVSAGSLLDHLPMIEEEPPAPGDQMEGHGFDESTDKA